MNDKYRGKFISIVIQPKVNPKFWLSYHSDNKINLLLMKSSFPLFTEIKNLLSILKVETINGKTIIPVLKFAFGTETSLKTKISHYQIYLEFKYLVRITKVYQELNKLLTDRVHIVVQKVYNDSYMNYCLKTTSNFQFNSDYYWNKKFVSEELSQNKLLKLINMRPKLKTIKENYLTLLIPIYIEIKVRILKRFPNNLEYKFVVRLQTDEFIKNTFSKFDWFDELLENVLTFKELMSNYKLSRRLETKWVSTSPYNLQSDIYQVYQKALFH